MSSGSATYGMLSEFLDDGNEQENYCHWPVNVILNKRYFKYSHTHSIHNHLETEIIFRPYKRMILYDDFIRLKDNLWKMLMQSCSKDERSEEEYRNHIDIEKVAINVDCLIIARDNNGPVAFASGTFINKDLFYINCAMTIPEYQQTGIGSIITAMLCNQAVQDNKRLGEEAPDFVCRTQNQKAASSILRAMKDGIISTEHHLGFREKEKIFMTARFLNCPIELACGISPGVYPKGLPKGENIKNNRVNKAFEKLGATDGCYVLGKINEKLINYLMVRHVDLNEENTGLKQVCSK